ncbi:hypothetical protein OZ401_000221 [Candidatus Chlorohelix allophototropha]|uniref:B box-type domain-containing protein n=1 Tax=Candidatus Chlorohelix allophototropha TaxID=3003348 RepID=A0ABY9B1K1_9CHLR|nr:hypothetical protein OZ401_000221 [Chloroflexota bacterium L227-S17]
MVSTSHRNEIDSNPNPEDRLYLKCGACGKAVLTRDMTLIAEGVRCRECMAKIDSQYASFKAKLNGDEPSPQFTGTTTEPPPQATRPVIEINVDTTFCKRHPTIETGLKCGRCGTPICPRCMVYTPVGVRCPDCARTPVPTVGVSGNTQAQAKPRDTGFRTYWKRETLREPIRTRHYVLAALAAVGTAFVAALVWGFLLGNTFRGIPVFVPESTWFSTPTSDEPNLLAQYVARSFIGSIHLFPEIFLALLVSEAISRATGDKRTRGLQFIAVGGVLLGIFLTFVVLSARIFINYSNGFPPLMDLLNSAIGAFGQMFQGDNLAVPIFWFVALALSWMRLSR